MPVCTRSGTLTPTPPYLAQELQQLTCGEADVDVEILRAHTRYGAGVTPKQRHVRNCLLLAVHSTRSALFRSTDAPLSSGQVRFLWTVLDAFSKEQRRMFLKFMWGRTRLPLTEQDWGEQKMRIHTLDTRSPDTHFPVAHTCAAMPNEFSCPMDPSRARSLDALMIALSQCPCTPGRGRCFFSIEWPQYSSLKIAREKLLYAINNCNAIDADNTREGRANASTNAFRE